MLLLHMNSVVRNSRQPQSLSTIIMQIRATTPEEITSISDFVVRLSMQPAHHIVYFGGTPEEITHTVRTLGATAPINLAAYDDDGRLIGMLSVETDSEIGRGWLQGPVVEDECWATVADSLYRSAMSALPTKIVELEISCDLENSRALEFAARHGFVLRGDWYFLTFSRSQIPSLPRSSARPIEKRQHAAVQALHDRLFADANTPGAQMIAAQSEHACLLVDGEGDRPNGYIYLTVEPASGEAFIDFVGVDDGAQGRGIGRNLVIAGMHWLFGWPTVEQVALAVRTDNEPARRLYEKTGFTLERTTRALRRKLL